MKYNKNLKSAFKGKKMSYSTSVTMTKGEKIAINLYIILFIVLILLNIFIFKNIISLIISLFIYIFGLLLLILFFLFRPIHKSERIDNERFFKN